MREAELKLAELDFIASTVLLKTKGVDPAAHPVLAELVRPPTSFLSSWTAHGAQERVKAYFGKVAAASKAPERASIPSDFVSKSVKSSTAAPKLDKDAANRFIKHAIASSGPLPPSKPASNPRARPSEPPEIGTSSRFSFLTKPNDHVGPPTDSDEDLAVIDDAEDATRNKKGKGKATDDAIDVDEEPSAFPDKRKKSKRPKVDPFAGALTAQFIMVVCSSTVRRLR